MIDYLKTKRTNGLTPVEDPLFSISQMAEGMNMSVPALYNLCTRRYGISPRMIIENLRLARCKILLKNGFSGTNIELATLCGYEYGSFTRMIKRRTGLTITQMKKGYENDIKRDNRKSNIRIQAR